MGDRARPPVSRRIVPDPQRNIVFMPDISEKDYFPTELWGR